MKQDFLTLRQVCDVADLPRSQIDTWISRGIFQPANTPEKGEARKFTVAEAIRVATMAELVRMGISPKDAGEKTLYLRGFKDGQAVLVVWTGPGEVIPVSQRGAPAHETTMHPEHGFPKIPEDGVRFDTGALWDWIVKPEALPEMIADPDKRALVAVNLDHIEARVKAILKRTEG